VQIIDWPQYVETTHPHADELLGRDVLNVLKYFKRKYNLNRDQDEVMAHIKQAQES
jgi:RIO kinase 2